MKILCRFVFKTPKSGKRKIEATPVSLNTLSDFLFGALKGYLFESKGDIVEAKATKEFGDEAFTEIEICYL